MDESVMKMVFGRWVKARPGKKKPRRVGSKTTSLGNGRMSRTSVYRRESLGEAIDHFRSMGESIAKKKWKGMGVHARETEAFHNRQFGTGPSKKAKRSDSAAKKAYHSSGFVGGPQSAAKKLRRNKAQGASDRVREYAHGKRRGVKTKGSASKELPGKTRPGYKMVFGQWQKAK